MGLDLNFFLLLLLPSLSTSLGVNPRDEESNPLGRHSQRRMDVISHKSVSEERDKQRLLRLAKLFTNESFMCMCVCVRECGVRM